MGDRGFPEEDLAAALERAGPLQDKDLTALAQELDLEFADPSRWAHFVRIMQWSVTQFATDTIRQACWPRDHLHDLLEYLAAHPNQLPAFLDGELGNSPRFRDNITVPVIRNHLLNDGPAGDD